MKAIEYLRAKTWALTFAVVAALCVATSLWGDTITFPGGASIDGDGLQQPIVVEKLPIKLTAPSPGLLYQWEASPGVKLSKTRGGVTEITAAPQGKAEVTVYYAAVKNGVLQPDERSWTFKLVIGGVAPQPPPTPPDPPKPPTPPEPISTSPFAEPGLRVLVCFDPTVLRPSGSPERWFYGPDKNVRDWLNAKCVPDPTGIEKDGSGAVLRDWRIWPATENGQPTDVSGARKVWRDAWANKGPEKKNWIMVGDGKTGYEGPLPKSEEEALTILRKVGGN